MYNQNPFTTFQGFYQPNFNVPPPPLRPMTDQEYVKLFESQLRRLGTKPLIQDVSCDLICDVVKESEMLVKEISILRGNMEKVSDIEWLNRLNQLKNKRALIDQKMNNLREPYLSKLRKRVSKINARKARRKRIRAERKQVKEEWVKQQEERSRKIDENLQKIKDEDDRKKQEEESKAQADIVLKEIIRKKASAKKYIEKLDALIKLRRARQNTARGRGEDVSERDAESFNGNIEKLKSLWHQKLVIYNKEESELRSELKEGNVQSSLIEDTQKKTVENLEGWKMLLFGGTEPQRDFGGDIGGFVRVRTQWDHYVSGEGNALPVGWVAPSLL